MLSAKRFAVPVRDQKAWGEGELDEALDDCVSDVGRSSHEASFDLRAYIVVGSWSVLPFPLQ